ncbi:MAG: response regulator, partial [Massilia sp.]
MPTALIADDEALMRDQLRARLHEAWPELRIVAEAANGVEAVALAAQHKPDIAFLDIRMPGMGGIDAARQLYADCHIVFATAYDQYAVE